MIGIYGGTFDPVHYGHLRTALEVYEKLGLHELRMVPSQIPPHRLMPGANAEQRLLMLRAALDHAESGFSIDTRELERPGPSYMVDTLASIRAESGTNPLVLILGMDAFLKLPGWHRWESIFELAHIAVMRRSGHDHEPDTVLNRVLRDRLTESPDAMRTTLSGRVHLVDVTALGISATGIRNAVARGLSPRYLTPDPVIELIREFRLYQSA